MFSWADIAIREARERAEVRFFFSETCMKQLFLIEDFRWGGTELLLSTMLALQGVDFLPMPGDSGFVNGTYDRNNLAYVWII